jgi:hypothetical protein
MIPLFELSRELAEQKELLPEILEIFQAFYRDLLLFQHGRPDGPMTAAEGYCSGTTDLLTVRLTGSFTLDGELFACAGDTMRVQSSEAVRFVPL